jgi:hypothetical protein
MKARTLVWLGMVALIAAIAMPSALNAQADAPPPAASQPPAISAQDLAFGRFIALIRAHLSTGDELAALRQWDAAAPHFGFPREEIYGVIRDQLRIYNTPPFDGALKELVRAVKSRDAKQFPKARQKVDAALAAADANLRTRQPNWPRFTVAVAIAVLKSAPDEYDDAVAKGPNLGRIVRPIGYQTARGFVLQADRMIESVAGELQTGNVAALADIRAGFSQLKTAFASVAAPKEVAMTDAAFQSIVAGVESAAARLI